MKLSAEDFSIFLSQQYCDNTDCSCYEKRNAGNLKIHSRQQGQIYCNKCKSKPFVVTKGTIFYWLKKPLKLVVETLMLLARGMGVNNTCAHQGVTADSILLWIEKAGKHSEEFTDFMTQNMDLDQVQIDEFWSYIQKKRASK